LLEDKTRSRNPTLVGALALLRNTLLFMHKEQEGTQPCRALSRQLLRIKARRFPC
jgi:hypothetical protein